MESGDGILVQFVEQNELDESGEKVVKEEDEEGNQSDYSEEKFEEEEQDKGPEMIDRIPAERVKNILKHIRLLFMIKKVPREYMVTYLLSDQKLEEDEETNIERIGTQ